MSSPTQRADALITLTHVTLDWSDGTRALDDVSGSFGHGRTGLVGRNGSGKTTLLRLATGELAPTSGSVHVAGTVAALPQQLGLDLDRSVADALGVTPVLAAIARIEGGSLEQADFDAAEGRWGVEAEALATLTALGLTADAALLTRPLGALSGGEVVTVGLAALQLQRADVALLDEPTNNLDHRARERLVAAIDAWPAQRSLVVVSHDTELLEHVHDDRLDRAQGALTDAEARVREDRSVRIDLPGTRVPAGRTVLELVAGEDRITVRGPERIALTGPNGAGKTTLLREVLGLPTAVEPAARLVRRID